MSDLIRREDAVNAIHKYFVEEIYKTPHEIDEDGYDIYTDMKTVNSLLTYNKKISKAIKALPSADRPEGEWVDEDENGQAFGLVCVNNAEKENRVDYYCPNCGVLMERW